MAFPVPAGCRAIPAPVGRSCPYQLPGNPLSASRRAVPCPLPSPDGFVPVGQHAVPCCPQRPPHGPVLSPLAAVRSPVGRSAIPVFAGRSAIPVPVGHRVIARPLLLPRDLLLIWLLDKPDFSMAMAGSRTTAATLSLFL